MTYPDNFLKGITQENHLTRDNEISSALFHFDERHGRDEWVEQSICWEDDNSVVNLMLNQKKVGGTIQFKAGIVRVPLSGVHYINNLSRTKDLLSYERQELEDSPYHGNLLLRKNTHKFKMRTVAAALTLHITEIITRDE